MTSGFLRRSMSYLGLAEGGYDEDEVQVPEEHLDSLLASYDMGGEGWSLPTQAMPAVKPVGRKGSSHVSVTAPRKRPSHSTALSPHVYTIAPREFGDAKQIADGVMTGEPVIINLETAGQELKRRIIDFCSGVTCALGGSMERIATNVFQITPTDVELSAEERQRV